MIEVTLPAAVFAGVMGLLILLALVLLWRLGRGRHPWAFADMLVSTTRTGEVKADRQAFTHLGAFLVSTGWGTYLTVNGELTEWFFNGYMLAWGGAYLASRWLKMKTPAANGHPQSSEE